MFKCVKISEILASDILDTCLWWKRLKSAKQKRVEKDTHLTIGLESNVWEYGSVSMITRLVQIMDRCRQATGRYLNQCWPIFLWKIQSSGCWESPQLQWRHNEHNGVSNHHRLDCLHNRLLRRRSKKTSKLCVTGLCEGNTPVTGEFPHKGPITRKMFHLMTSSWHWYFLIITDTGGSSYWLFYCHRRSRRLLICMQSFPFTQHMIQSKKDNV